MRGLPNTPSQRWARSKGACSNGRRDLGWKSIGEYWRTSQKKRNLFWILCRLTMFDTDEASGVLPAWVNSMEYGEMTPKEMRAVAHENGVMIPLEIS